MPGLITVAPLHTNFTAPMSTTTFGNFSSIETSERKGINVLSILIAAKLSPVIRLALSEILCMVRFFVLGASIFHCTAILSSVSAVSDFDNRFDFNALIFPVLYLTNLLVWSWQFPFLQLLDQLLFVDQSVQN